LVVPRSVGTSASETVGSALEVLDATVEINAVTPRQTGISNIWACSYPSRQPCDLKTDVSGIESTRVQFLKVPK